MLYEPVMYESFQQVAPIIAFACVAYITICQIWLRVTLRKMNKQQKAINDARCKYARELNELVRARHLLDN